LVVGDQTGRGWGEVRGVGLGVQPVGRSGGGSDGPGRGARMSSQLVRAVEAEAGAGAGAAAAHGRLVSRSAGRWPCDLFSSEAGKVGPGRLCSLASRLFTTAGRWPLGGRQQLSEGGRRRPAVGGRPGPDRVARRASQLFDPLRGRDQPWTPAPVSGQLFDRAVGGKGQGRSTASCSPRLSGTEGRARPSVSLLPPACPASWSPR